MDQEGDIKDTSNEQGEKGASADDYGEERRDFKTGGDDGVALEVLLYIPPRPHVSLLREVNSVERERIDGLARSVGE